MEVPMRNRRQVREDVKYGTTASGVSKETRGQEGVRDLRDELLTLITRYKTQFGIAELKEELDVLKEKRDRLDWEIMAIENALDQKERDYAQRSNDEV